VWFAKRGSRAGLGTLDPDLALTTLATATARPSAAMWLLCLPHLLALLSVFLLHLLCLLLVSLLRLLRFHRISLLFRELLVFLVLFLLECLTIPVLLGD
jgi:hypothetical protein